MANSEKRQKLYPRLTGIKDNDTRESLKLIWDELHNQQQTNSTASSANATAASTISDLQATVQKLQKTLTQVAAGAGTTIRSTVGGGGSGGTTGGSGAGTPGGGIPPQPAPSNYPKHQDVVQQAITDLTAASIDLSGYCGSFQITKLVAWRLKDQEPLLGLAAAKSGSENNCDGYTTDVIVYRIDGNSSDLYVFDILTDSGGPTHSPVWNYAGTMAASRWSQPIPPVI